MRRLLSCVLSLTFATPLLAQHLQPVSYTAAPPQQTAQTPTFRATANLVVVDVVVRDEQGKPIHNLKPEDFALLEGSAPQRIRNFEEHIADEAIPAAAMPKLPPGIFTNMNPAATGKGPLNILVLDKLDTEIIVQSSLRTSLMKFIDNVKPGTRIAIFQLGDRLQLLQGFTDDHDLLHATLTKFVPSEATPSGSRQHSNVVLDVMRALNAYVAGFPGRKNVLWYSGQFPLYVALNPPNGPRQGNDASLVNDFRQAADQLAANQVSVYPIDARGLTGETVMDVIGHDNRKELGSMTGGKAYYTLNGMDTITADAIGDGANYYVLTYTPTDARTNSNYRRIEVKLPGNRTAQLSFRQGYYANDPNQLVKPSIFGKAKPVNDRRPDTMEAAMMMGAPVATQILFAANVMPVSGKTEKDLAPDNAGSKDLKGPYERYKVRVATDIRSARLTQSDDGTRHGSLQCLVYVYDRNAAVVNGTSRMATLDLKPGDYQQMLKSGLPIQFEISVPAKGDYTLRIAIHDLSDDHVGSVEVPVSAVPPAVAAK